MVQSQNERRLRDGTPEEVVSVTWFRHPGSEGPAEQPSKPSGDVLTAGGILG